jgi:transcriptional regulator with XRE-family HTH domain
MGRGKRPIGPLNEAIAAELRMERARARLTFRELSEASGVSRSTLSKMLNGEAGMDIPHLQAVCAVFGVSLRDAIGRAEASLPPDDPPVDLPVE